MARDSVRNSLQHFQTLCTLGAIGGLSDHELLAMFLLQDERNANAAFKVLVQRHGPMVMGVCRRMLAHHHAAEDAFQATFLILVRCAGTASRQAKLASWLHGVAVRAAKETRRSEARRLAREKALRGGGSVEHACDDRADQIDLKLVLDEELSRLPGRYRAALVACELEGKSRREACWSWECRKERSRAIWHAGESS